MKTYKILLVDDENDILEFLSYTLRKENFEVFTATDGRQGIALALEKIPDLILLDVMMPHTDGIATCEELRKHDALGDTIIAFLTARGEDYSQIAGFEAGGDDYISKPIRPKVLVSRINALLKRRRQADDGVPEQPASEITIDSERFLVYLEGREIVMPKKEFKLLSLLYSKPEKVFLRDNIYSAVWGNDAVVGDRTIDVHVRKLREKLGDNHIKTVKGVGYKFVP